MEKKNSIQLQKQNKNPQKIQNKASLTKHNGEYVTPLPVTCVLSHVPLFATLWTGAHQAPLSMGILQARILKWVAMPSSREDDWSGLPFPTQGDLPDPGFEPEPSALAGGLFTTGTTLEALPVKIL